SQRRAAGPPGLAPGARIVAAHLGHLMALQGGIGAASLSTASQEGHFTRVSAIAHPLQPSTRHPLALGSHYLPGLASLSSLNSSALTNLTFASAIATRPPSFGALLS